MLIGFLRDTLGKTSCLNVQEQASLAADLDRLLDFEEPYVEADLYDRLTGLAIKFVRANSECIRYEADPNQYR